MKVVNFVALPIVGLVKQTMMKLGGWRDFVDFMVVKMNDFDVSCKQNIRQPNGFKTISIMQLDKNPTREEPKSTAILLEALGKSEEIVPKDTLCVLEKCHGGMLNSWSKPLPPQRMIDYEIEPLLEAKVPTKNAYRMTPPELTKL
ncbi:gag-asp_proteas domain-containing protein [Cucumis melo var. makuwa]|uniref:Gag-asp_proteas domain-containing protein n=1 Tax=Cucumis melo var. makuwa TaxID=1194695 RepID=A0A5D3C589_CUCMM|nr:gag-asp_proteas domain-containing protein [Cucumis melo var. makuwa]